MIALEAVPPARRSPVALAVAVVVAGCAALLARPWLVRAAADPTAALVVVFVAIGLAGALLPVAPAAPARRGGGDGAWEPAGWRSAAAVLAVGGGAFLLGRLLGGGVSVVPPLASYVALNTLAAVSEEALFRRLLYGVLQPHGAAVAVVGSAAAFAVVHVTVWGMWALPLDVAAGLVLSWQRWASGRWSVPAVTHAAANLLAVL